jgi:hypothetical protein
MCACVRERERERERPHVVQLCSVLASIGNATGGYSRSGTLYNEGTIILGTLDILQSSTSVGYTSTYKLDRIIVDNVYLSAIEYEQLNCFDNWNFYSLKILSYSIAFILLISLIIFLLSLTWTFILSSLSFHSCSSFLLFSSLFYLWLYFIFLPVFLPCLNKFPVFNLFFYFSLCMIVEQKWKLNVGNKMGK